MVNKDLSWRRFWCDFCETAFESVGFLGEIFCNSLFGESCDSGCAGMFILFLFLPILLCIWLIWAVCVATYIIVFSIIWQIRRWMS